MLRIAFLLLCVTICTALEVSLKLEHDVGKGFTQAGYLTTQLEGNTVCPGPAALSHCWI